MNLIIDVNGSDAIPIRAIPFITGWTISPDVVATALAHTDHWITRLEGVVGYHLMTDGEYAPMLPKEWDGVEAGLSALSDKLKAGETVENESYPQWRHDSIHRLPAGCFVWKEDFETAFYRSYSPDKLILLDERPGDRELNFVARVPTELVAVVMEGFGTPHHDKSNPEDDEATPENLSRRQLQHEMIFAVIGGLGFNPMQIPDGGKAKIKMICLTRPRFFTRDGFDHAWQAGVSSDLFRLINHDNYSSK